MLYIGVFIDLDSSINHVIDGTPLTDEYIKFTQVTLAFEF